MKTWEKNIRQVLPYIPGEQPKQADIIKLNTNENPYPPSPRVAETLEQFQTGELRLYPDPDSNILVEALADFYQIDNRTILVWEDAVGNLFWLGGTLERCAGRIISDLF